MRVLVQRSGKAKLKSDGKDYSSIDRGLMLLVGFTEGDGLDEIKWMVNKIVNLRIFDDEEGVMNKSILTNREKQVFELLIINKSTKEIAKKLNISEKAKNNLYQAYKERKKTEYNIFKGKDKKYKSYKDYYSLT